MVLLLNRKGTLPSGCTNEFPVIFCQMHRWHEIRKELLAPNA